MIGYRSFKNGYDPERYYDMKKNTLVSCTRSKKTLKVLFKSTFDTCHGLLILDWHYTALRKCSNIKKTCQVIRRRIINNH